MAFFSRDPSFHPLFRLLDDYQSYSGSPQSNGSSKARLPSFHPKFDARELEDAYELHGELAGIRKENLQIEFSDPHTLHIRGSIERSYTSGTPPAAIEGRKTGSAITDSASEDKTSTNGSDYKTTVEAEDEYAVIDSNAATPAEDGENTKEKAQSIPKQRRSADTAKYWVSERSIGEFSRTFNFPGHIQQDAVSASLHDGILTVRVPKAPKNEARRQIQIN